MAALYFVYIIRCSDGSLYTGIAHDIERRFAQHAAGRGARYTRSRGVEAIIYQEGPFALGDALRRERAIKALSRSQKDRLIGPNALYHKDSIRRDGEADKKDL